MINLIPPDFAPSGATAKLVSFIRNSGLVLFAIFLLMTLGMIGVFIYYAVNLNGLKAKESQLSVSVKTLEATEQKLVLIKDRINYAQKIMSLENSVSQVDKLAELLASAQGVILDRSDMTSLKNDTSFSVPDLNSLKTLFLAIKNGKFYESVVLDSFNFNPQGGYQVSFTLSGKTQ